MTKKHIFSLCPLPPLSSQKGKEAGFTIVELLLYVSVMAILLLGLSLLMSSIYQARTRQKAANAVEQQGIQIMQLLIHKLNETDTIIAPLASQSGTTLSLNTYIPSQNPTVYSLTNGSLSVTVGSGVAAALHNDDVILSDLAFRNVGVEGTQGAIQIIFTLSYAPETPNSFNEYSRTFQTAVTLHQP